MRPTAKEATKMAKLVMLLVSISMLALKLPLTAVEIKVFLSRFLYYPLIPI